MRLVERLGRQFPITDLIRANANQFPGICVDERSDPSTRTLAAIECVSLKKQAYYDADQVSSQENPTEAHVAIDFGN